MNQFIGFAVLLAGLFAVATMLLWRLPWPRREPWRTTLEGVIVIVDLAAALWLNRFFSNHYFELISTTLACSHFSFVCFWCVTSRGPATLRLGLFLLVIATMFALFMTPPQYFLTREAIQRDWMVINALTQRMTITCVATSLAGIFCRLRGWRLEWSEKDSNEPERQVHAKQMLPLLVGLGVAVPCVIALHEFVQSNWTHVFNRDFSILALGCLYGVLMLAVLSMTVCRFRHRWITIGLATLMISWLLWELQGRRHDSFNEMRYGPGDWSQYDRWLVVGTLWWWLVWKHLEGVGFALRKTDESIVARPKLKHIMLGMVLVAALFTSVKSRYFDRYDDLVREAVSYAEPSRGPLHTVSIHTSISERTLSMMRRLPKLRRVGFYQCTFDRELMQQVLQLEKLNAIAFVNCDLSATGLEGIQVLQGLEHVELISSTSTPSTDDCKALNALKNLKRLALSDLKNAGALLSLPSIQHLDLSYCQLIPGQLESIQLKNLRKIDFPLNEQSPGFNGVPAQGKFPQLTNLKVQTPRLAGDDVERLQEFSQLEELELIDCRDGLEQLQKLNLKRLTLRKCSLTATNLEALEQLDETVALRWVAEATQSDIQQYLSQLIALAKRHEIIDVDIAKKGPRMPPFPAGMATPNEAPPPFQPLDIFRYQRQPIFRRLNGGFKIQTDGPCQLSDVTIEFEDLLGLLPLGEFKFNNVVVTQGNRKMASREGFSVGGFSWDRIKAEDLFRYLAVTKTNALSLLDPQLDATDEWARLAGSGQQLLSLTWSEMPEDWEQILEQLNVPGLQVFVQSPLDTKYKSAKARIQEESGGRIVFRPAFLPR